MVKINPSRGLFALIATLALLLAVPVAAQGEAAEDAGNVGQDQGAFRGESLVPGARIADMSVGAVQGSRVINAQGEDIGFVRDLVVDQRDQSLHAIVDIGGWLGIGGTRIAVPAEQLQIAAEDQIVYPTEVSEQALERRGEAYDPDRYVSIDSDALRLSVFMDEEPEA